MAKKSVGCRHLARRPLLVCSSVKLLHIFPSDFAKQKSDENLENEQKQEELQRRQNHLRGEKKLFLLSKDKQIFSKYNLQRRKKGQNKNLIAFLWFSSTLETTEKKTKQNRRESSQQLITCPHNFFRKTGSHFTASGHVFWQVSLFHLKTLR